MQKLNLAHGAAPRPQTLRLVHRTAPVRQPTALAAFAGQVQSVLTELLAGDAYRYGVTPPSHRDTGLWG